MRRNNIVRIDGLLAQETVELLSLEPVLRVRVAVDTAPPEAGGRHYVLFEDKRAIALAAYLAAAQAAGAPLPVSVSGSLRHVQGMSLLTDLAEASFGTFRGVRNRAEDLLRQGVPLQPARGPRHPLDVGYHRCAYLGGTLILRTVVERERKDGTVLLATLDTGDPGASGRRELVFATRHAQERLRTMCDELASMAERPNSVEANAWGTLYSVQGFTAVMVTGIEFPQPSTKDSKDRRA